MRYACCYAGACATGSLPHVRWDTLKCSRHLTLEGMPTIWMRRVSRHTWVIDAMRDGSGRGFIEITECTGSTWVQSIALGSSTTLYGCGVTHPDLGYPFIRAGDDAECSDEVERRT